MTHFIYNEPRMKNVERANLIFRMAWISIGKHIKLSHDRVIQQSARNRIVF